MPEKNLISRIQGRFGAAAGSSAPSILFSGKREGNFEINSFSDSSWNLLKQLHHAVLLFDKELHCIKYHAAPIASEFIGTEVLNKSFYTVNNSTPAHIRNLEPSNLASRHAYWEHYFDRNENVLFRNKLVLLISETGEPLIVQCIDIVFEEVSEVQHLREELELIKKSHKEVSEVIENATEIIFKLDVEGNFVFLSAEFERSLGHKREQLLGTHFSSVIHPDDLQHTLETFGRILKIDEIVPSITFRVINSSGYFRWFSCSAIFMFDEQNSPTHSIGFAQDITEFKEAVRTLQASEERYATFINQASQAIWRVEADKPLPVSLPVNELISYFIEHGYICECNQYMAELHGFKDQAAVVGQPINKIFALNDPDKKAIIADFIMNGFRLVNREVIVKDANGNRRSFLYNIHGIVENDCLVRIWGTQQDITQQRMAEKENRHMAQVLQDVSDAIISTDLDFIVTAWNKTAELLYQISAEEVLGKPIRSYVVHEYIGCTRQDVLTHLLVNESWEGECYFDRKDGSRIYLLVSMTFVKNEEGERIGFAGIHKDRTAARIADIALKSSEERYRSLVNALGEGIVLLDAKGTILAANKSAQQIMHAPIEVLSTYPGGYNQYRYLREDGSEFPLNEHPAMITLQTGRSIKQVVLGLMRPDDTCCWISINTEPVYYSERKDKPDAVVASFSDVTESRQAKLELQRTEERIRDYSDRITNILDSITDGFIAVDRNMNILLWNRVIEQFTGISASTAIGRNIQEIFPALENSELLDHYQKAINSKKTRTREHYFSRSNIWFETSAYPSAQGLFVYFRDITERKEQERILAMEKEVLEINALPETSLKTTINYYLKKLEQMYPSMICSVLGLKEDRRSITCIAAPSLDPVYTYSIEGVQIGVNVGSCGSAMYLKRPVITTNIQQDPLWENYRELAARFNLEACWSFPILNTNQEVEATLAIYHRYPKAPTKKELNFLERESKLLGIIINNKKSEEKIKVSYERYLLATRATNDVIYDWDIQNNLLYWAESFFTHFGYLPAEPADAFDHWKHAVHPEDRDRVVKSLDSFLLDNQTQFWECEYRIKHSTGKYLLIQERGFLVYNLKGEVTRMVGSIQDVTEKKRLEKKLVKQEIDRQKMIAQAVVDAQEKERAEIGKELHDNVNQILSTARLYLELAASDEKERINLIKRSTNTIYDAINEIRAISRSLVPPSVSDLGLIESVQDLVENIRFTRKLNVEYYFNPVIDKVISEQQKLMLFRIVQEQVNNVLKHAEAKHLIIEIELEHNEVHLTLSDDGRGFDQDNLKNKKGVGLTSIKSRVELFNGKVKIDTRPGHGCTLNILVPIINP